MSLIADILTGGTSGLLGSVVGMVGGIITSGQNRKQQVIKNEHEIALGKLELQSMIKEAELNLKATETEVQGEIAKIDAETYKQAIKDQFKDQLSDDSLKLLLSSDKKFARVMGIILASLKGFNDFLKGFIRPALTVYLVTLTVYITGIIFKGRSMYETIGADGAEEIIKYVIYNILFLTNMVVTWWFQNRQQSKFSNNLNDGNKLIEK